MRFLALALLSACSAVVPEPASPVASPTVKAQAPGVAPATVPEAPARSEVARAAHDAAQARVLRRGEPLPELALSVTAGDDAPLATFIPVADPPAEPALSRFHAALRELAKGDRPRVRIAMYGASGTAADVYTAYVRAYLQHRFGDGGPGFVPLVQPASWHHHAELVVSSSKGWLKEHAQIKDARPDGRWGLQGMAFSAGRKKAWSEVAPRSSSISAAGVSAIEVHLLAQPGGGRARVRIDDRVVETIATRAEAPALVRRRFEVPPGTHRLRVETLADGEVRALGAVLERADRGVVVDTLGIEGTRAANHLEWDEGVWSDAIVSRAPDLVTLSYGTNEAMDTDQPIGVFEGELRRMLERLRRTLPHASCVLLGPGDFPELVKGEARPRPRLREIIEVERRVAAELGCGFWDALAVMGGDGAMARWVAAELARDDHVHLRRRGAALMGAALVDALMQRYDQEAAK